MLTDSVAFYGVIDLLSVLPYYLELILQQDTVRFTPEYSHHLHLYIPVCILQILHITSLQATSGLQTIPLQPYNPTVSVFIYFSSPQIPSFH